MTCWNILPGVLSLGAEEQDSNFFPHTYTREDRGVTQQNLHLGTPGCTSIGSTPPLSSIMYSNSWINTHIHTSNYPSKMHLIHYKCLSGSYSRLCMKGHKIMCLLNRHKTDSRNIVY